MKQFFYPESIAIFGVSDKPSNFGRIIVENLVRFGFQGRIYPIGRGEGTVGGGLPLLRSLDDVNGSPELAAMLIPAAQIPGSLDACGRKGVRHVIIESGGFSEFADERRNLEEEILRIARTWNIKVLGPNCFGATNLENGLVLPFFIVEPRYMKKGAVAMVSQSGGLLYDTLMLSSCENLGLSKVVSIGNKLMLNENDLLEYLISDNATSTIGLYLENFSDGRRTMELAASTDKPVVVLKANRSPAGERIALFHTTALAGDDEVVEAALRQTGIVRVRNLSEMIESFKIFNLPPLKGPRLALITRSGGHGVVSADAATREGLELAAFSRRFYEQIEEKKKGVIRATNPLDVGDVYDLRLYADILELALQEPDVDGVVFIATFSSENERMHMQELIRRAAKIAPLYDKPTVLCMMSNREQWFAMRLTADFPVFGDVDTAIGALGRSFRYFRNLPKRKLQKPDGLLHYASRSTASQITPAEAPVMMSADETFRLLARYGLPVADYAVVRTLEEALDAAGRVGYPVALKMACGLHKTEKGGVRLDLRDAEAVHNGFSSMKAEEYIVQKMAPAGQEVILGVKRDAEFGPVLLFGLGGIFVELMRETVIRLLPVDERVAREMVGESKAGVLLGGFRGRPAADRESLIRCIVALSRLVEDHPEITNLDINPLIVLEDGKSCVAVDAKVGI
jgi:acetate---CoA ligase (ADP-forming)